MEGLSRGLVLTFITLVGLPPFPLRQAAAATPMRAIILFDISAISRRRAQIVAQ
jgi:hypothetical protein